MQWNQFKRDFQEVVLMHLDKHYKGFMLTLETDNPHRDDFKDTDFKEFVRVLGLKSTKGTAGAIKTIAASTAGNGLIDFTVGPASYSVLDDPCALAAIYKNSKRTKLPQGGHSENQSR